MLYTNEKIIIDSEGNFDALESAIMELEEYLEPSFPGLMFHFQEEPFPHYAVPEGIEYVHLKNVLGDQIKRRAINENVYDIQERTFTKEFKHYYTQRELEQKADELAQAIKEKDELEIKKKALVHQLNEEIKEIDVLISNLAMARREKCEIRTLDCKKQLNLKEDKVYYLLDEEIVCVEDMTPQDRQLFINFSEPLPSNQPENPMDLSKELGVEINSAD